MTKLYEQIDGMNPNVTSMSVTVTEGKYAGEQAYLEDGVITWCSDENGFLKAHADALRSFTESGLVTLDGIRVYAELLGKTKKLVICGGGHVSLAVIRMARMIGCDAIVIEDRPMYADLSREAGATEVICETFKTALKQMQGDDDTYFVIVTRGHKHDEECLREIVQKPHAYIGMIGSRRRVAIVKNKLAEEGISKDLLDSIHSPIGLNIGAETPEEIAVAIIAEIIEVKNKVKRNFGYPSEILRAILDPKMENPDGRGRVLSTIVSRQGSAPRGVGAKMLIEADGTCTGTIGGGCVEAEVVTKAREMLATGAEKPVLYRVDLTDEEAEDEGMVCGGTVEILLDVVTGESDG